MWDRVTFKNRAKAIMKDHYWKVFIACLIASVLGATSAGKNSFELDYNSSGLHLNLNAGIFKYPLSIDQFGPAIAFGILIFVVMIIAFVTGFALHTFVFNPLRVGFCRYLVLTQRYGQPAEITEIFWGFGCGHYMNLVKTMFFRDLYVFLWGLLLIIPGIIKSYEYTCVPYILAEHPEMECSYVLTRSAEMTDGYKFEIFILELSFIGWLILGSLLLGIGTLFVIPYIELTNGEMYAFLRSRFEPNQEQGPWGDQNHTQDYSQGYTY